MRIAFAALVVTMSATILAPTPALAQDGGKAALDRLKAAPVPSQQGDLDTMGLASAHRERAESIDQRTSGLWQSWLVSICEGCGPERHLYSDRDTQDFMRRQSRRAAEKGDAKPDGTAEGKPEGKARRYVYFPPAGIVRVGASGSLYNDLSNHNIDQIRRDPNR
ncbi:hypothetical protein [Methylobacterium organophilum]|uniref:Uncharacterized protein n=1 Tax=Methylobacterium organophilum TaxID=410 RepID=A0ABQ4T2V8_METOR|nr:hypothetical protein [Methylobacterium organophilum]UMY17784.1 hypothetical protein MMB17_24825 [Methylobacterium organophilum]GJE25981.1 hypothetical protein LKMONMHP_0825 [Methylobacterium organophilum]